MPIDATVMTNVKADRVRRTADLSSRKHRERSGRFLIEGPQAVREALTWQPGVVRDLYVACLLYTSPSPRDSRSSRMPSSA